jgi:outer membrane receptor protein involved in Fe transport
VSGAAWHAYQPATPADALQQQAGIATFDDLGSTHKINMSMRGFTSSPVVGAAQGMSVFLDGVRMNESDDAEVNFDLLPIDQVSRVEILAGNGSLLGRNSLGGAINFMTPRGDSTGSAMLELSGGSFGNQHLRGAAGGRLPHDIRYYVGATAARADGWRQATAARSANGLLNIDKDGRRSGLRVQALVARSRAQTAGSLPESVFGTRPDSNLSAGDDERLHHEQLSVTGYLPIGAGRGSFVTYARHSYANRFNVNQEDDPDARGVTRNRTLGYTANYRATTTIGQSLIAGVRIGLDGSVSRSSVTLYTDSAKFDGPLHTTTRARSPSWDIGPFIMTDLAIGRVTGSAGLRYDHVVLPFHDLDDPTLDDTGVYDQLSPRIGLAVTLTDALSLYGSWSRSFRAPSLIENACANPERACPLPFSLGDDPPLEAVSANTVEGGINYNSTRIAASAVAYSTNVANDIVVTPNPNDPDGSSIDGYFINLAKTRRQGIEADAHYHGSRFVAISLGYALTLATYQSQAAIFSPIENEDTSFHNVVRPGNHFPLVPKHQIKGSLELHPSLPLTLGVQSRFIGAQWLRGDESNAHAQLPSYVVMDARAGVTFGGWRLTAVVTNLFNRRYANFGTFNVNEGAGDVFERFLTPGARRAVQVAMRHTWGTWRDTSP